MMDVTRGLILAATMSGLLMAGGAAAAGPAKPVQVGSAAPVSRAPGPPPEPPVILPPPSPPPAPTSPVADWAMVRGLTVWQVAAVSCADGGDSAGLAAHVVRPLSTLGDVQISRNARSRQLDSMLQMNQQQQRPQEQIRFDIDASGQPVSIQHGFSDIPAALAASRFSAVPRHDCTAEYRRTSTPLTRTPVTDLLAYTVNVMNGPLPREGWVRITADGNCHGDGTPDSKPAPLLRGFPDFRHVPATPGVREWSAIGYDTDAAGKPVHVHVRASSGASALDAAAVKAVQVSRFTGGARAGCTYPYWRKAAAVPAPEMPAQEEFPSAPGCPADVILSQEQKAALSRYYPKYFRDRQIEGWAIVSYDVAPWGAVGNVKVLAAQPAMVFGEAASRIMTTAKVPPSQVGASGCVQRIRYRQDAPKSVEATDDTSNGLDDLVF